ncbi:MAG TPA: AI-2E family transporter [Gammaproteobacteria bacterium]|nr:AI-2E family transporter [Gammaproteobacteria bacterium]
MPDKTQPNTPDAERAMPLSVDMRSLSLVVLAVLAAIFMLHWARAVFIPLLLGLMISYTLSPAVDRMQKWHVPRAIGAAVLLLAIVAGMGATVYSLSDDAAELIDILPEAAVKIRLAVFKGLGTPESTIEKMQEAASQLEKAASETASDETATPVGVTRVQIEKPEFKVRDYLWMGTKGALGFVGQLGMVLFLAFFVLVSGDTFRRKMVRIAGPTLSNKKVTLQVLDDITAQIQRYLLVQIFTSILVGVATWLAFLWIGMEHAPTWGVIAGVLKIIPYLGPVIVTVATFVVGFLQFEALPMALLVSGVALLITSLEGYLLTPWLIGRASRMSPVVIFIAVLFWGWLWGVWGLLLGVPIIMIMKVVCDRVEDLRPIGELLGD